MLRFSAELGLATASGQCRLPSFSDRAQDPAGGHAAARHALDVVLDHEVEAALGHALERLPAFDRVERPRDEGEVLQRLVAIVHPGRQVVVPAVVREVLLAQRFEHDLDLLLEEVAVRLLVEQRRAEGLDLAGVVAASDAEDDAPTSEDVDRREVLREAQRVPHGHDVERAAEPDPFGHVREVQIEHQQVRQTLVSLALEMVLGRPESVVALLVHRLGDRLSLVEGGREHLVREVAGHHRRAAVAHVLQVDVSGVEDVEPTEHGSPPRLRACGSERVYR